MKIDKINDEFIVDCTNNSTKERQQVYKFLVDNRDYPERYFYYYDSIIVCNKITGSSRWDSLSQYYSCRQSKKDIPVYTFEQFKQMYLNENKMYSIKDLEKRKNGKCWVVQINTENEHKFLKSYFPEMTYYKSICNGYIVDMTNCGMSEFCNYDGGDYNKITINQIKEWNMENKEIIGYKLIKPEYEKAVDLIINANIAYYSDKVLPIKKSPKSLEKLKNAGVLDLWFEKIYEKEYKVGDWITITEVDSSGWLNSTPKRTFQIDGNPTSFAGGTYWKIDGGKALHAKFRKATSEEIQKAQKTIVKMYSSNKGEFEIEVFDGKAYYRLENKYLPKEWIKSIIKSFNTTIIDGSYMENPYKITISSLNVGCYHNCKKSDWENVYKLLK